MNWINNLSLAFFFFCAISLSAQTTPENDPNEALKDMQKQMDELFQDFQLDFRQMPMFGDTTIIKEFQWDNLSESFGEIDMQQLQESMEQMMKIWIS